MHPVILFAPFLCLAAALFTKWKKKKDKQELRERRRRRLLSVMATKGNWIGVDLAKSVSAKDDTDPVSQGTLYPILHGLELDGLVQMHPESPQAVQFSLTPKGRQQAVQHLAPLVGANLMPFSDGVPL